MTDSFFLILYPNYRVIKMMQERTEELTMAPLDWFFLAWGVNLIINMLIAVSSYYFGSKGKWIEPTLLNWFFSVIIPFPLFFLIAHRR